MIAATTSDVINTVLLVGSGGLLGVILKHKISNRQQKQTEFQSIVDEYKSLLESQKTEIESLKLKVDDLTKEYSANNDEITSLRNQLILFESSHTDLPLPMWMKDREGRMVYLNSHYEDVFLKPRGYKMSDYVGSSDYAIWPPKVALKFTENDIEIVSTKTSKRFIECVQDKNGEDKWLEVLKYPRFIKTSVIGISGIVLRISDEPIPN